MASVELGQVWPTNNSGNMVVVEYINSKKVKVRFIDTGHEQYTCAAAVRNCYVKDMSKFSTEGVVEKLKKAHHDKNYDYSKVIYKNTHTNVTISCQLHGEWQATPHNLLAGQGCPSCAEIARRENQRKTNKEKRKYTRDSFIEDSVMMFGNKFSYNNLEEDIYLAKITITCNEHGDFKTKYSNHLRGLGGCQLCNPVRQKTGNEFIDIAKNTHGDRFCYNLLDPNELVAKYGKLTIVCKKHGEFSVKSNQHILQVNGGCQQCAIENGPRGVLMTQEEFIQRSEKIHNNKFDYSLVKYKNANTLIDIICPVHSVFQQTPERHLSGRGCRECSNRRTMTQKEWFDRATEMHGERYDYTKSHYTRMKDKITITCRIHGDFKQDAWNHLQGVGCPSCGGVGFTSIDNGVIYLLQSDDFFKIGITNSPVEKRVRDINQEAPTPFSVIKTYPFSGDLCLKYEKELHRLFRHLNYKQPTLRFDGFTECFVYDNICKVVDIVESFMKTKGEEMNGS